MIRLNSSSIGLDKMLRSLETSLGTILSKAGLIPIAVCIFGNENHTKVLAIGQTVEHVVDQVADHGIEFGRDLVLGSFIVVDFLRHGISYPVRHMPSSQCKGT